MRNLTSGNIGLAIASIAAIAMSVVAHFCALIPAAGYQEGICFPGPGNWNADATISWILNLILLIGAGLFPMQLNKTYNFINNTDTVIPTVLLVLCGSNVWLNTGLNQSLILALLLMFVPYILFDCYRVRKSMNDLFLVGTLIAICSMFEYAALPFVVAVIIMGIVINCLSFKGFSALLMGLAAPYAIVIGFGIADLQDFKMPQLQILFTRDFYGEQEFILWLNAAITALIFGLCSLYNAVGLYAGNTRRRKLSNCLMIMGWVAIVCIVLDSNNMAAYLATLYFSLAVQMANLFGLHQIKYRHTMLVSIVALYVLNFVLMLEILG